MSLWRVTFEHFVSVTPTCKTVCLDVKASGEGRGDGDGEGTGPCAMQYILLFMYHPMLNAHYQRCLRIFIAYAAIFHLYSCEKYAATRTLHEVYHH